MWYCENHNLCTKRRPSFSKRAQEELRTNEKVKKETKKKRFNLRNFCFFAGKGKIKYLHLYHSSKFSQSIKKKHFNGKYGVEFSTLLSCSRFSGFFPTFVLIRVFKAITQLFHNKRKSFLRLWNTKSRRQERFLCQQDFVSEKRPRNFFAQELFAPKSVVVLRRKLEAMQTKSAEQKKLRKNVNFWPRFPRTELQSEF